MDTAQGGTHDITTEAYTSNSSHHSVQFSRSINTGDSKDKVITVNSDKGQEMSMAFGGGSSVSNFAYHSNNYAEFSFGFPSGFFGKIPLQLQSRADKEVHGWILFVCWGILADLGIMAARNFRHNSQYLNIHGLVFLINDILNIVMIIIALTSVRNQ